MIFLDTADGIPNQCRVAGGIDVSGDGTIGQGLPGLQSQQKGKQKSIRIFPSGRIAESPVEDDAGKDMLQKRIGKYGACQLQDLLQLGRLQGEFDFVQVQKRMAFPGDSVQNTGGGNNAGAAADRVRFSVPERR